ncbi:MBL fold metallo-hydrolase [Brevibacillus choshinensis]|uniref:MBL fold metallo-hydrolase n=1 Tax=Brevibacillus choshinensis TaxID=54911 RepID=A0ABX7FME1_BRECH|nr:MBL fold metallo-hydrolase [Brevibacillus choshinensis]QRG66457.1 MBL fold metallo-hydrolase [Brevibacillus choshinensis]
MHKQELSDGIVLYTFNPDPGKHVGFTITALIEGNQAILIDTAYENQAREVYQDLEGRGIAVKSVILSHFHPDHINGLKALPEVPLYGSVHYQTTLDQWTKKEDHPTFTPSVVVEDTLSIRFGRHTLTLSLFPGHAPCSILVNINDEYVHIGDELLFSNQGEPLLPSVDFHSSVKRHFDSLTKLKDYSHYTLIPSHGAVISGKQKIEKDIANRIAYLRAILGSSEEISYEEATRECDCTFLHSEWHKNAYR